MATKYWVMHNGRAQWVDAPDIDELTQAVLAGVPGDLTGAVTLTPNSSARNVIQPTVAGASAVVIKPHAAQAQATPTVEIGSIDSGGYARFDRRGRLRIKADNGSGVGGGDGDTVATLDLENLTTYPYDQQVPGTTTGGFGPSLNWIVNGVYRWSSGMDFYGIDYVPVYHKGSLTPGYPASDYGPTTGRSTDVHYITGEDYPRHGFLVNRPRGTVHMRAPAATAVNRPALIAEGMAGHAVSIQQWDLNGSNVGYIWKDGSLVILSAPSGSAPAGPAADERLSVGGVGKLNALRLLGGAYTDYALNQTHPMLYSSGTGGSGVFPFDGTNLVYQPRTNTGGGTGGHVFAAGDPQIPVLYLTPGTSNVAINPDPAAPTALFGGASRVLGLRNVVSLPANTSAATRPANGMLLFAQGSQFFMMEAAGSMAVVGQVGGANGAGIAFSAFGSNTRDARISRDAAKVLETNSVFRYNDAASWQTTVGAAGAGSALPATPTKYLKVRDDAGTTYVVPAYAAA